MNEVFYSDSAALRYLATYNGAFLSHEEAQLRRRIAEIYFELTGKEPPKDDCDPDLHFWFQPESSPSDETGPNDLLELWVEPVHATGTIAVDVIRVTRLREELRRLRLSLRLVNYLIRLFLKSLNLRRRFSCLITHGEKCWRLLHGSHPPKEAAGLQMPAFAESGRVVGAGLLA